MLTPGCLMPLVWPMVILRGLALHFVPAQWFTSCDGRWLDRLVKAWALSQWHPVGSRARLLVSWGCVGGACFKAQERSGGCEGSMVWGP